MSHRILFLLLFGLSLIACDDEPTTAEPRPVCGDGRAEAPESCDGSDLKGLTCQTLGLDAGALMCNADCTLDTSECNFNPCEGHDTPCGPYGSTRCLDGWLQTCTEGRPECPDWALQAPCPTGACADEVSCANEVADPGPVWFVHVSDVHFGKGNDAATTYAYLLETVVPAIGPAATFQTGDMVDDGDVESHWLDYDTAWRGRAAAPPEYLEIAGNHDVKGDGEAYWLAHTPTGAWDPALFGVTSLSTGVGDVEIVRTNTSAGSINIQNTNGYFDEDQAAALLALTPAPEAAVRVLLAHHPTVGILFLTIGRDRMREVMAHFGSELYLCGHIHSTNIAWDGPVLLVQAAEFGEDETFMIVAKDGDSLAAREFPITGPWVMITSPTDPDLGENNPRARPFSPGSTIPVRAVGFALRDDLALQVKVNNDAWSNMTMTRPGVWEADVTLPSMAGSAGLTVRGSSSEGSSEHTIQVTMQ